ncbi:MAG: aldo/keto reductase [Asgard group archaeon]|nr:aldo/keto reductase [Asgard group archaeon]
MSELTIESTVKLNNGIEMPILGLGTYLATDQRGYEAVRHALKIGYRHIDTAAMYGNEREVGNAIKDDDVPREDIYVTTKLWNSDHGYEKALAAFEESYEKMGLDYIDLYLIHWPVTGLRLDSWRALEQIQKDGKVKSIGVSNYTIRHIEELLKEAKVIPVVNQVEFHPYLYQKELQDYCMSKNIWIQSYSPLTKGQMLDDPPLVEIARKNNRSTAQILIRWAIQRDTITLPKSANVSRIMENAEVFDWIISEEDMKTLDSLNRNMHVTWDPTDEP